MPTILELSEKRIEELSSSDSLGWIVYNGKIYMQNWKIDSEDLTARMDTIQLSESLGYATDFVGYYQNNKNVNANDPNGKVYMVTDNSDILCVKLDNGGIVWLGIEK